MHSIIIRTAGGIVIGALLGLAYHYFVGCRSGSCPITANPYLSMLYGALLGFIVTYR